MSNNRTVNRHLACTLTENELLSFGTELADVNLTIQTTEAEKKEAAKAFNATLKRDRLREKLVSEFIRTGIEEREVNCQWNYDFDSGRKTLVRNDTGEVLESDMISDRERQDGFFDNDE